MSTYLLGHYFILLKGTLENSKKPYPDFKFHAQLFGATPIFLAKFNFTSSPPPPQKHHLRDGQASHLRWVQQQQQHIKLSCKHKRNSHISARGERQPALSFNTATWRNLHPSQIQFTFSDPNAPRAKSLCKGKLFLTRGELQRAEKNSRAENLALAPN